MSGADTRNGAEQQPLNAILEELLRAFLASPQCARMVQSLAEQVTRDVGGKRVSDITSAEQLTDFVHENVLPALRNPELSNTASGTGKQLDPGPVEPEQTDAGVPHAGKPGGGAGPDPQQPAHRHLAGLQLDASARHVPEAGADRPGLGGGHRQEPGHVDPGHPEHQWQEGRGHPGHAQHHQQAHRRGRAVVECPGYAGTDSRGGGGSPSSVSPAVGSSG